MISKGGLKFLLVMSLIILAVATLLGGILWSLGTDWTDTGYITAIGQKTYNSNGWVTPYTVTTMNHGVFNFDTQTNKLNPLTDNYQSQTPVLGMLVGVKHFNAGVYHVEVDP